MKISVIMPSFLGEYEGCATDREDKLVRAINSFLSNSYPNKELIVIGDNCEKTENIINEMYGNETLVDKIKFFNFKKKQPLFSGKLRSKGIEIASGQIICYLDSDDIIADGHLDSIVSQMIDSEFDWCYYNDFVRAEDGLHPKTVELEHGSIGTSSIAHLRNKKINWDGCDGYGHDYKFVQRLMNWSSNYDKIYGCTYIICHVPNQTDK